MRILATSDIHSPKYLGRFRESLKDVSDVDVVLLAGDLTSKGDLGGLRALMKTLEGLGSLVIAVPGNEDYDELVNKSKNLVRWLNDEHIRISIGGIELDIIGSRGVLDKPTAWQSRNIPNIHEIYEARLKWLRESLGDNKLLLTHYASTYATLVGEEPRIWPMLGTRRLEDALARYRIVAIHGHAHESKRRCIRVGRSLVINASFPNLWRPVILELDSSRNTKVNLECLLGHLEVL